MRIEDEIKQQKFSSEYQKAIINILYTSNFLSLIHSKTLKPYGISPEQFNILRILRGQYPQPATVKLLIERMLNKSSNASRLVEKLRLKGLVDRKEVPNNRREVDVFITEKGLELLDKLDKKGLEDNKNSDKITDQELKELNRVLDKIRE
jgi:DNA-binding MarR family transcriptional regulator